MNKVKRKLNDIKILCPGFPDCPTKPNKKLLNCKYCPWFDNYKEGRKKMTLSKQMH